MSDSASKRIVLIWQTESNPQNYNIKYEFKSDFENFDFKNFIRRSPETRTLDEIFEIVIIIIIVMPNLLF